MDAAVRCPTCGRAFGDIPKVVQAVLPMPPAVSPSYRNLVILWRGIEGALFAGIPVVILVTLSWLSDQNQVERVLNNAHWISPLFVGLVAPIITGLARSAANWWQHRHDPPPPALSAAEH